MATASDTALAAIETRTRAQVSAAVTTVGTTFGNYLTTQVASSAAPATGTELLSRDDVHQMLTTTLASSQQQTQQATNTGYHAAVALAALLIAAQLGEDPQQNRTAVGQLGELIAEILEDIAKAYAATFLLVHDHVRAGYDGVSGGAARHARVLTTRAALNRAVAALNLRAQAAASVAVHRGFTDAETAIFADYAARHPGTQVVKRWRVISATPCAVCAALDGTTTALDGQFDATLTDDPKVKPMAAYRGLPGPPRHPNCFPAGTIVSGPGTTATYTRWFDGEMVEVRTEEGRVLAGTPNHPVLTEQGWLPLGVLNEGTNVVGDRRLERMLSVDPYDHQQPALIEQVSSALRSSGGVTSVRMPISPEDFHGDGADGQVDVVWSDRLLRHRGQLTQPLGQKLLVHADPEPSVLAGERAARLLIDRVAATTGRIMGSPRQPQPVLFPGSSHPGEHRCASIAQLDTRLREHASHRRSTDAKLLGQTFDALSGLVTIDKIVQVRRYPFAGHVYNIGTTGGWYIANGVLVHNCRCRLVYEVTHS